MELSKYPEELTKKRSAIECNFIFSLYKEPDLIDDYKNVVNGTDILTDDGIFYYGLAQGLAKSGYNSFDNTSMYTYLEDKKTLKEGFNIRGGYHTVQEIMGIVNTDNVSTYYDELVKNNMLLRLYDDGFDVMRNYEKFKEMSSEELYDFYDFKLNNLCIGRIEKIKAENLSDGYDEYIDMWDKGDSLGYKIGYPMLNYRLAGLHRSNLLLHLAHIGNGKTTSAILFYILPAIESGEDVLICANEQTISEWRSMILSSVLFNKVKYRGMNRQKFTIGHFTDEQKDKLKEAQEWLRDQDGKITLLELDNYEFKNIKKILKKYSKLGVKIAIIDTLKPEQENSDKAWADFSEVAKSLFQVAKKEDMAIVATAQLSSESMARRFLDLSCIGKSKAIAETATQVVCFRSMTNEEKTKLKPYFYKRKEDGKYEKMKTLVTLDEEKDYIILFTPKNRFGETSPQIVYERNMSFNYYKELGYIDVQFDGFGRR